MEFSFSQHSLRQLDNADGRLVKVCYQLIRIHDFKVNETYRDKAGQDAAIAAGTTKVQFPNGKHNQLPSRAMDLFPFVNGIFIGFSPKAPKSQTTAYLQQQAQLASQWAYFGGLCLGIAASLGIPLRWGHDWNQDNSLFDQSFVDAPHFELSSQ